MIIPKLCIKMGSIEKVDNLKNVFICKHNIKEVRSMQKIKKFFAGVKKEMGRVRWPKKKDGLK